MMRPTMRPVILMTRPAPEGADTARDLAARTGCGVVVSPLLAIRATGDLPDMTRYRSLIFTSRNGVRAYAALNGPKLPATCVGEATARAARDAGHPARASGGDAEALVADLRANPPEGPILHLRGEIAQGDIAPRLTAAGLPTDAAVIYAQDLCDLTDEARQLLSGAAPVIVPLYSPRTAARFAALCPKGAQVHLILISRNADLAAAAIDAKSRSIATSPDARAMAEAMDATLRRVEGIGGAD